MKILNLMNKKKLTAQGSITVFMTFIFMIILSLILAIFENTRIISSTGYMKNASLRREKKTWRRLQLCAMVVQLCLLWSNTATEKIFL